MYRATTWSTRKNQGWIELTIGVLEQGGIYHALSPSLTVAEGHILSLEEKFQGGTGINITPPPQDITPQSGIRAMKKAAEQAAQTLGIQNYARLDIFYNTSTTQTILIEANSLPALTPSTVIYHQALAEDPPLTPTAFLETLINLRMGTADLNPSKQDIKGKQA
jgi:D-alanine-D-alanine ligase-like ATP-grasp enzyme